MVASTETTQAGLYRLEIRQGNLGWRWHVRGPKGIEGSSSMTFATRDDALESGRTTMQGLGFEAWDEWVDGITDHTFDPRTLRMPRVDPVAEAKAAGLEPPDPAQMEKATQALRELEAKREEAAKRARENASLAPDAMMGVEKPAPQEPTEPVAESPLRAQRKRSSKAKTEE